jgi:hypothetical protein
MQPCGRCLCEMGYKYVRYAPKHGYDRQKRGSFLPICASSDIYDKSPRPAGSRASTSCGHVAAVSGFSTSRTRSPLYSVRLLKPIDRLSSSYSIAPDSIFTATTTFDIETRRQRWWRDYSIQEYRTGHLCLGTSASSTKQLWFWSRSSTHIAPLKST